MIVRLGAVLITFTALFVPFVANAVGESLKGKTNDEILHLMLDGKSERKMAEAAEVETHLPKKLWELPPRDAALKLVEENCDLNEKKRLRFFVDAPDIQPPINGTVGLRWFCSHCVAADYGLTVLRYDGDSARLSYSKIRTNGRPSEGAIRRAVDQTKTIELDKRIGRQLFETIWWLGKVRFKDVSPPPPSDGETIVTTGTSISTGDGDATFWVTPGQRPAKATLICSPVGGRYGSEFNRDLHATFAKMLFEQVMEKYGIGYQPTAEVGKETYSSPEQRFVLTQKEPATGKSKEWVDRTLKILTKSSNKFLLESAVENLVSFDEPMRFNDKRVDQTLLKILERAVRDSNDKRKQEDAWSEANSVARPLAWRDRTEAFPLLMQMLENSKSDSWNRQDVLEAATILAGKHPEFRSRMIGYLQKQSEHLTVSTEAASELFDAVWRQDFREIRPQLQKLATASVDEFEDSQAESWSSPAKPLTRRFHDARKILLAWSEPDPLTKLKLDALIEASSTHLFGIAQFLQTEYDDLPSADQAAFRDFVAWMKQQKIKYNWDPDQLEPLFNPAAQSDS